MTDPQLVATAVRHQLHSSIHRMVGDPTRARHHNVADHTAGPETPGRARDRGAVSLEQVLWFVAAGVSVAVIAGLVWSQIRDQANAPIVTPSAP